jgi:hypothetical protein
MSATVSAFLESKSRKPERDALAERNAIGELARKKQNLRVRKTSKPQ